MKYIGFLLCLVIVACSKKTQVTHFGYHPQPSYNIPVEETPNNTTSTNSSTSIEDSTRYYTNAYTSIVQMLQSKQLNFKKAVFITENAWYNDTLIYASFENDIQALAKIVRALSQANIIEYTYDDHMNVALNASIFKTLTDTNYVISDKVYTSMPYTYDHNDPSGKQHWTNMFVTKLLHTHSGNCHSLPYLYKILALETHAPAWLAFAPNHMYIKAKSKKTGMYNTELTSAEFPTDAWVACSGYISTESITSGIYMDTLNLTQSVAYTLFDLAKGYQRKFGINDGSFILRCLNTLLIHYPNCINAWLLKAEVLTQQVVHQQLAPSNPTYQQMEDTYAQIHALGYRHMPEQNYAQWLQHLHSQHHVNTEINTIFKPHNR